MFHEIKFPDETILKENTVIFETNLFGYNINKNRIALNLMRRLS